MEDLPSSVLNDMTRRRVDRQLTWSSGRQGDPGSSQFLCILEDNLMRFLAERLRK